MVELVCTVTEKSTEGILRERVGKTFLTPPPISPLVGRMVCPKFVTITALGDMNQ